MRCLVEAQEGEITEGIVKAVLVQGEKVVAEETELTSDSVFTESQRVGERLYEASQRGEALDRIDELAKWYGRIAVVSLFWRWVHEKGQLPTDEEAEGLFGYVYSGKPDSAASDIRARLYDWGEPRITRDLLLGASLDEAMRAVMKRRRPPRVRGPVVDELPGDSQP